MVALKQVTKNFISEVMEENWNKYREAQQDQADFQCSIYIKKKKTRISIMAILACMAVKKFTDLNCSLSYYAKSVFSSSNC